jgi:hypothetical protein
MEERMKKDKTKAAVVEAKPAPALAPSAPKERPFDFVPLPKTGPTALRGATTDQIKKPDLSAGPVEPPQRPSIQTRALDVVDLTAGQWLDRHAKPEELRLFKAAVLARQAKDPALQWRKLPGGNSVRANMVLAGCLNCGRWVWTIKPNSFCAACNPSGRQDHPGQLRPATGEETAAWFEREKADIAKFQRSVFNMANGERQKNGLDPLSWEQWTERQRKDAEAARESEAQFNKIVATCRAEALK